MQPQGLIAYDLNANAVNWIWGELRYSNSSEKGFEWKRGSSVSLCYTFCKQNAKATSCDYNEILVKLFDRLVCVAADSIANTRHNQQRKLNTIEYIYRVFLPAL